MKKQTAYRLNIFIVLLLCALSYANYPTPQFQKGQIADRIEISKGERKLRLYSDGVKIAEYDAAFGRMAGRKEREGDNKTPEGIYKIDFHKPDSAFHLALHLDYPNKSDKDEGRTGSNVMIHGIRNGLGLIGRFQSLIDWSRGCVSLNNRDMEEIYHAVPDGAMVEITS